MRTVGSVVVWPRPGWSAGLAGWAGGAVVSAAGLAGGAAVAGVALTAGFTAAALLVSFAWCLAVFFDFVAVPEPEWPIDEVPASEPACSVGAWPAAEIRRCATWDTSTAPAVTIAAAASPAAALPASAPAPAESADPAEPSTEAPAAVVAAPVAPAPVAPAVAPAVVPAEAVPAEAEPVPAEWPIWARARCLSAASGPIGSSAASALLVFFSWPWKVEQRVHV